MLTLYARKEPTVDTVSRSLGQTRKQDVVIYRDKACTERVARWPWFFSGRPRRNSKTVVVNCWRFALEWVPALSA